MKHDNHCIYLEWRITSDHAFITINIFTLEECVQIRKQFLLKNSEEEAYFIDELIYSIKRLNTDSLLSIDALETVV